MTPERWSQIRQIFDGALERPDQDRAAYLRVVCARDEELRREVEALLTSYVESGTFLNRPAIELERTFLQQLAATGYENSSGSFQAHTGETGEYKTGFHAGPYQLQKRIGRGGMGSVWLANRFDSDFTKSFAVKLVKPGMNSQEILRRFRLEREVLSGLDHPNIARLIDGGSTPDGLPYLVMEYVEGTPIDQFCESRHLSITDRLKLFRQVCSAVQYAHQHLVVHRDIKTGNILVTAEGAPKLLDFGIAKLMHSEFSTLSASETRPDMRPMTLDYASPEQVRGDKISTATDIYSLGVLLYKLLTGKFPYGPEVRSHSALQHAICEIPPVKPSAVILSDAKASIPAATQAIQVGQETRGKARQRLKKKLAGDLDMILLMALRKEPHRRYLSAEQFSDDVGRYLEGRPVIARRDTFSYRAGKFARRNPAGVAAGALMAVALVLTTGVSTYYARQAGQQRTRAELQLQTTRTEDRRQERELIGAYFRLAQIQEANLKDAQSALETYRLALAESRSFTSDFPQQAEGRLNLARAAMKVGDLAPAEAQDRYSEAVALLEGLARGSPPDPAQHPALGGSQDQSRDPASDQGQDSARIPGQDPARDPGQDLDLRRDLLAASHGLGVAQYRSGNLLAALSTFSRALQLAEAGGAAAISAAGSSDDRRAVAAANLAVGEVLLHNGETEASIGKLRKAVDLYSAFAGVTVPLRDTTPAGYQRALRQIAASAPVDRREAMETDLAPFFP